MIPEAKREAVARALESAFGVRAYEAIEPLAGSDGLSLALVYRVVVQGRPYLLRFVKENFPGIDPEREFASMRQAAEAGLAPRVHFTSTADRLMIVDFIEHRPLPEDAARQLAPLLRRLHDQPGRAPTTKYLDSLDGFVRSLRPLLPPQTAEELLALYARASAVYPRDEAGWVPCHNDLKPQNTLYDGERFWLIDWEAAFMNDRYVDLAVTANFHTHDEAEADAFLAAYFGAPPSAEQRARLFLMQQIVSVGYAAIFASIAARAGLAWEPEAPVPDFGDFHRRIVAGELDLGGAEAKRDYARLHLSRALEAMRSPRFTQAIARLEGVPSRS